MGRRCRDGCALVVEAVEQTFLLQLFGIVSMVSFQFVSESDLDVLHVAAHGLSGLILGAQRIAAHESGGFVDKELHAAVAVRVYECDGPGSFCGDGVEGLGDRLLLCCFGKRCLGCFANNARETLPFMVGM